MNLLVLSNSFPPVGGVSVRRLVRFLRGWTTAGIKPVVVTTSHSLHPLKAQDPEALKGIPPEVDVFRSASLEWLGNVQWLRTILSRILLPDIHVLWIPGALATIRRLVRSTKFDAIYATGGPFSTFVLAALARRICRCPLVLDFRDEWSTHPVNFRMTWDRALKLKLHAAIERWAVTRAAGVVVVTNEIAKEYRRIYPLTAIHVVTNSFDPGEIGEPLRTPEDKFVISYVGSLYPSVSPVPLLQAIRALQREQFFTRPVVVKLYGQVHPAIRQEVGHFDDVSVEFYGFVPHRLAMDAMKGGHLNLLIVDDVPGYERYHNAKLFEYLGVGRPILALAKPESAVADIIYKCRAGWVAAHGDQPRIQEALCEAFGGNFRFGPDKAAVEQFRTENTAIHMTDILKDIVKGGQSHGA